MRRLILVKHSAPELDAERPPAEWRLSAVGRERCRPLAEHLAPLSPTAVVSSVEPKAAETARLVAAHLGVECETSEGLHEHQREWLDPPSAFERAVERFFAEPDRLVFGHETADAAHGRFDAAVARTLERHSGGNPVVVAHGTVIALYVSRRAGVAPFPLWKRLGLPAFAVL